MDYEEFFGFKDTFNKKELVKEAKEVLIDKGIEVRAMDKKEKDGITDYLEKTGILPSTKEIPKPPKKVPEEDMSLLNTLRMLGVI